MGTALRASTESASHPAASFSREILKIESVENVGKKLPGYSFGRMCKALWPSKTPASIEFYTGMPERTARHVAGDRSDPGSAFLVKILDSEQGWRALCWIMRRSQQPWWLHAIEAYEGLAAQDQKRAEVRQQIQGRLPLE